MKTYERVTEDGDIQYFQKISKRELAYEIREAFETGQVEDFNVYWEDVYGNHGWLNEDEIYKKPAAKNIHKLVIDCFGQCIAFFGCEIVRDDYGGWTVE